MSRPKVYIFLAKEIFIYCPPLNVLTTNVLCIDLFFLEVYVLPV